MVFAFAGDSTTTTFMNSFDRGRAAAEIFLTQRDSVARVTLDPPGKFQFEQQSGNGGG